MRRNARPSPLLLAATAAVLCAAPARAQAAADSAAIRAAALDYIDGWWSGDSTRMKRALHPQLAKRIMMPGRNGAPAQLEHQGAETLVAGTARGGGTRTPAARRRSDVRILDVTGSAASVKIDAGTWVDYLHVARGGDGRWVIVNVLWELTPRP